MRNILIDEPRTHRGVSDASGAVSLEPGGTRFLVASDEDQDVTCIRLYDAAVDGDAIQAFSLAHEKLDPDPPRRGPQRRRPFKHLEGRRTADRVP